MSDELSSIIGTTPKSDESQAAVPFLGYAAYSGHKNLVRCRDRSNVCRRALNNQARCRRSICLSLSAKICTVTI